MGVTDRFPVLDVRDVQSRPDDVGEFGIGIVQRTLDVSQRLLRLPYGIANADNGPVLVGRRRSRDVDLIAPSDCYRVADL